MYYAQILKRQFHFQSFQILETAYPKHIFQEKKIHLLKGFSHPIKEQKLNLMINASPEKWVVKIDSLQTAHSLKSIHPKYPQQIYKFQIQVMQTIHFCSS